MKTSAEWKALSESVTLQGQAFIDGQFRNAVSGETFPAINPATEQKLTDVASCDEADVDLAVSKASGYGRDKSLHALEKYTDLKTVWISL